MNSIPCVPSVEFLLPLLAGEVDVLGIDDYHDIAIVLMRRIRGLILALRLKTHFYNRYWSHRSHRVTLLRVRHTCRMVAS